MCEYVLAPAAIIRSNRAAVTVAVNFGIPMPMHGMWVWGQPTVADPLGGEGFGGLTPHLTPKFIIF